MTRILIVDDKEDNRYYLQALLSGNGYDVETARHGAEALVTARQAPPDAVVSDLLMPVMDGYTLLRHWRADPRLRSVPFIVYTATYTEAEDEQLAYDLGADAFILKPAEPDEFLARLAEARRGGAKSDASRLDTDERAVLEVYSQTLIRKLEEKSLALQEANAALQRDLLARQTIEEALKTSDERFRLLAKATNDAIWDWDLVNDTRWWNEGFETLFGYARQDETASNATWTEHLHDEDRQRVIDSLRDAVDGGDSNWSAEYRFHRSDGLVANVEDRGYVIRRGDGRALRMVGAMADVTARKALEAQLHQAQRLEAIGQLTGGVAHDFNNLLTVILGNAELISEQSLDHPHVRALADLIVTAAQRGADLTRRLLAFARRQMLVPAAVDLNALVAGLQPLLRRTLGSHIEMSFAPAPDLWTVRVDPAQLESALLNLCLNARDAMQNGGSLTIETSNATLDGEAGADLDPRSPGDYGVLTVADTGTGIPPELLTRVFEPFFTTKADGKGSGLGLAMVYGFVKQSAGHVRLESEPGRGTTVRLFLPRTRSDQVGNPAEIQMPASIGGDEVILLVEDDDLVRRFAHDALLTLGYRVIEAHDGASALDVLRGDEPVDLLLTDVIMPGISGSVLAEQARLLRRNLRVLYTSGFTQDALTGAAIADGDVLLNKPYQRTELASRIRQVLDG